VPRRAQLYRRGRRAVDLHDPSAGAAGRGIERRGDRALRVPDARGHLLAGRMGIRPRPGAAARALAALGRLARSEDAAAESGQAGPEEVVAMKRYRAGLIALLVTLGAASASAQRTAAAAGTTAEPGIGSAIARARAFITDSMGKVGIPGVSVTVMREGRIIWSEGIGWADLEQRVAVTPLTRFRVGSVSKPLTATAIGLLVERGRLDLDAPVQRYVPSFPTRRHPVTTRQAAGHVAGIRHYRGDEFLIARPYPTVTEGLAI